MMIPFFFVQNLYPMEKKERIQSMFNDISGRYDFLNHFLSLGVDYNWRTKFVRQLARYKPVNVLDVATGTGDLAVLIATKLPAHVTGIDIAVKMLEIANQKAVQRELQQKLTFMEGDAEVLPFPDEFFDAVTVAFGVRNFEHLEKGLTEMKRVMKTGGMMMILEFSHPSSFPWKQLYKFYSRTMIPLIGRMVSRNKQAYSYLPESVSAFPSGNEFVEIMQNTGMKNVSQRVLTFGIATLYSGAK
jgi:demethylmenaquinone methyltransferase/2-methoxy-6-polyprenyl-1,4-benzoquinol methylase